MGQPIGSPLATLTGSASLVPSCESGPSTSVGVPTGDEYDGALAQHGGPVESHEDDEQQQGNQASGGWRERGELSCAMELTYEYPNLKAL